MVDELCVRGYDPDCTSGYLRFGKWLSMHALRFLQLRRSKARVRRWLVRASQIYALLPSECMTFDAAARHAFCWHMLYFLRRTASTWGALDLYVFANGVAQSNRDRAWALHGVACMLHLRAMGPSKFALCQGEALATYDRAIGENPDDPRFPLNRARCEALHRAFSRDAGGGGGGGVSV